MTRAWSSSPVVSRPGRGSWVLPVLLALLLAAPAGATAQERGEEIPESVPEHYSATEVYVQGVVVDVLDGGLTLMLEERGDQDLFGPYGTASDPSPAASFDSFIGIGADGLTALSFGRAQGWLFLDDPDGGPQTRIRLIEARDVFKPGQVVQVGRARGLPSSASHAPVSAQGRTPRGPGGGFQEFRTRKKVTIDGWVYVRVNPMREEEERR